MKHIMVDLETLGRAAGCVVLSIGAVKFSKEGIGEEFYDVFSLEDSERLGLHTDPDTLKWWESQSADARAVLESARLSTGSVANVLHRFNEWMRSTARYEDIRIWGNGASFDNPILVGLYTASKTPVPWKFWNERCYRTLSAMMPFTRRPKSGTAHNALSDARNQAVHAVEMMNLCDRSSLGWRDL